MNVGISSHVVKEISGRGISLETLKANLIELNFSDMPLIKNEQILKDSIEKLQTFDVKYTIHAPISDEREKEVRIDLGINSRRNIEIMRKVFKIASLLDVKYLVIHGGDIHGSYHEAFVNTKKQLRELSVLAGDYSIIFVVENTEDNRIGAFAHELLPLVGENVAVTLDVGHAFLTATKYNLNFEDYFNILSPYIKHVHLHNNNGKWDEHRPLEEGKLNVPLVLKKLCEIKPENIIFEIRRYRTEENVIKSLRSINGFQKVMGPLHSPQTRTGNLVPFSP
ncbi:sugar phosphate isomerase/epimerase [Thermococcus sp. MV5]|uniref:sugar phosphate isomerase/epimerase family protein n=1 Tax=Thermococcus sp. MV5 TaxID=1638272 RepID=UPI001438C7A7|nr:sugar phosphate isomerase/epimerase [Thermococcus sp. MV5]NJE26122.1 sugar phosphate isomerase/epimerase [Thermococcus sp. MV5]